MIKQYIFRSTDEFGNIQGCPFSFGVYRTTNEDRAAALRRSASFGKTVFEVTEDAEEKPVETKQEPKESMQDKPYRELVEIAKERGIKWSRLSKEKLAELLEEE